MSDAASAKSDKKKVKAEKSDKKKKDEVEEVPADADKAEKADKKKKKKSEGDDDSSKSDDKKKKKKEKSKDSDAEEEEEEKPKKTKDKKDKKKDKEGDDEESDSDKKKKKKDKKKDKKKKDDSDEEADEDAETGETEEDVKEPTKDDEDEEEILDFEAALAGKKKKKKKEKKSEAAAEGGEDALGSDPWAGSDRDYTYTELLDRVFTLLREKNPLLAQKKRHVLPPPQIVRVGTKKVMWSNFAQICSLMHRQPEHVMSFVFAELGSEGSIDGNQRLVIKGRWVGKQMESLLKKYIIEYVTCSMCHTPETTLTRDSVTRLYFIQCETCGSRRSVAPIKTGFHATGRGDRRRALGA